MGWVRFDSSIHIMCWVIMMSALILIIIIIHSVNCVIHSVITPFVVVSVAIATVTITVIVLVTATVLIMTIVVVTVCYMLFARSYPVCPCLFVSKSIWTR
jgi:hypothetical protein